MEKVEKVTVSVAIVLFDMKMHSNSVGVVGWCDGGG